MREITLQDSAISKLKAPCSNFKIDVIKDSIKSFKPGEWVIVLDKKGNESYLGFVNPSVEEKFPCLNVVGNKKQYSNPELLIEDRIKKAIQWRKKIKGYHECGRMIFGFADQLPGIIVDSYKNCVLVQINNAGFDSYRDYIKKILVQELGKVVVFWDQEKERLKEHLPIFEKEIPIDHLMIEENNFVLKLDISKAQKVGYYYDHRENRKALNRILLDFNFTSKNTVDLFSYLGSWAMSSLKAGSEFVTMVDQGDFLSQTEENFKEYKNKFKFLRDDVFKFLDKSLQDNQKYDLVISDPPAFAKSLAQASQAKVGYDKLHQKVFRVLAPEAIVVFASCTHYYSQQEMSTSIYEAAKRERKKIRLLHQGLQGFDHPIATLNDSSNYIKCLIYYVENL